MKRHSSGVGVQRDSDTTSPISLESTPSDGLTRSSSNSLSESISRLETIRLLYSTYHRLYWDSAQSLERVWGAYLLIAGALVGYVLTKGLAKTISFGAMLGVAFVSITTVVTFAWWSWMLHGVVGLIQKLTRELNPSVFDEFELNGMFVHWRKLLTFIAVCTILSGSLVVVALIFMAKP